MNDTLRQDLTAAIINPMFEHRVTKYDPTFRDVQGRFTRSDWTAISDIGQEFNDVVLTEAEYRRVESAYAEVAVLFLHEAGILALEVAGLENSKATPLAFGEGSSLGLAEIETTVRHLLREDFWCRLESPSAFVHVGWDYYMYVGVPEPCPAAETRAKQLGLFVEPFPSPYLDRRDTESA